MRLPDEPAQGTNVLSWAKQVQTALRSLWPRDSATVHPSITPNGTSYAAAVRNARAPVAERFQFQLADETTDTPAAAIGVRWGEIAGIVGDEGMDPSDDPLFTITLAANGVRIIYLKLTGAYDSATSRWPPTDCLIAEGSALPADSAGFAYVKIGQAERETASGGSRVKPGTIAQSIAGNQGFVRNYYSTSEYNQHTWRLT